MQDQQCFTMMSDQVSCESPLRGTRCSGELFISLFRKGLDLFWFSLVLTEVSPPQRGLCSFSI